MTAETATRGGHGEEESAPKVSAATLIPLRDAADGTVEVLMAQIEVLDALKSTKDTLRIQPFAGELRFFGGGSRGKTTAETPMEIISRELRELGFPVHERQRLSIHLFNRMAFHSEYSRKQYDVLSYVGLVRENPVALNPDITFINALLESTRRRRNELIDSDEFWHLPKDKRAKFATKIHQVLWLPLEEAMSLCDPGGAAYVNAFQQAEFEKFGLGCRDRAIGTWKTVKLLHELKSIDDIKKRLSSYEGASEPSMGSPSCLSEGSNSSTAGSYITAAEVQRRQKRLHTAGNVDTKSSAYKVLSYNLNVLPFEATFHNVGALHGGNTVQRLELFVSDLWRRVVDGKPIEIVALQEVFSSPFLPMLCYQRALIRRLRHLGYNYIVHPSRPVLGRMLERSVWTDSGLIIASRYPIVEEAAYYFRHRGTGVDSGAQKGALFARIEVDKALDLYVDIFNVHLQATHNDGGPYAAIRKAQMFELVRFIKQKTSCFSYPYLLTGDFNLDAIRTETCLETGLAYFTRASPGRRSPDTPEEDVQPVQADSNEYKELVNILSIAGGSIPVVNENQKQFAREESIDAGNEALLPCTPGIIDLLKEKHGGHISTRPPRQRFPKNIEYMMFHKYPQRLDYVFMTHGRLGQLVPVVSDTSILRFPTKSVRATAERYVSSLLPEEISSLPFEPALACSFQTASANVSDHYGIIVFLTKDNSLGTWEFVPPEIEVIEERSRRSASSTDKDSPPCDHNADIAEKIETSQTFRSVGFARSLAYKCSLPYLYWRFFCVELSVLDATLCIHGGRCVSLNFGSGLYVCIPMGDDKLLRTVRREGADCIKIDHFGCFVTYPTAIKTAPICTKHRLESVSALISLR
eukprot:gb/GECG01003329.1/.p1 GENE.gb/GECG01003329.1/~~gb/GECG01003329.1/.p1  ORF type:complete len:864 (+),score=87.27 gb/GECG01003329.1/:1-2592(+)